MSLDHDSIAPLDRALALLGPLEGRIMRIIWTKQVSRPFVVRDVQTLMPELAYTTVMTTVNRLTEKGILKSEEVPRQRAHEYIPALEPEGFLSRASRQQVEQVVERFGDLAIAAFAERLDGLDHAQLERLRRLGRQ